MDMVEQERNSHKTADYQLTKLAEVSVPQDILDKLPEDAQQDVQEGIKQNGGVAGLLESYLGTPVTTEQVERVLSSNIVKEILTVYTGDLTNVLTGQEKLSELDVQKIKTIVNNNMDEVVQIAQELKPDLTKKETEALKQEITKVVDEKAEEIIQMLPEPEVIVQQIVEKSPEIGIALKILQKKNTIQLALIGTIVGLCVLIFLCRLQNFRGFRWLAVDMFVGGGINALLSLVLLIETPVIVKMIPDSALNSAINNILHAFDLALFERAALILVAGGVLLTAYILIKKARAKKASANAEE